MGNFESWMIFTPLLAALILLAYYAWQAFKEIQPTLKQVKSLQQEIQKTKGIVGTLIAEVQTSKTKATEQAENAKELVSYSRQTFQNAKEVVGAVKSLDTLPVRRAISFARQKREEYRKPQAIRYLKRKARKVNSKMKRTQFGQLASLIAAGVLSAGVTIFTIRRFV